MSEKFAYGITRINRAWMKEGVCGWLREVGQLLAAAVDTSLCTAAFSRSPLSLLAVKAFVTYLCNSLFFNVAHLSQYHSKKKKEENTNYIHVVFYSIRQTHSTRARVYVYINLHYYWACNRLFFSFYFIQKVPQPVASPTEFWWYYYCKYIVIIVVYVYVCFVIIMWIRNIT